MRTSMRSLNQPMMRQRHGHSTPTITQKYAKLAPGAVTDEVAEILDQLATERAA